MPPRKGKDPLKPGTPAFQARQARWKHNALSGSLRRTALFLHEVIHLHSTTREAKQRAAGLLNEMLLLGIDLKTRVEPDASPKGPLT